jgi:hypothetical protein
MEGQAAALYCRDPRVGKVLYLVIMMFVRPHWHLYQEAELSQVLCLFLTFLPIRVEPMCFVRIFKTIKIYPSLQLIGKALV